MDDRTPDRRRSLLGRLGRRRTSLLGVGALALVAVVAGIALMQQRNASASASIPHDGGGGGSRTPTATHQATKTATLSPSRTATRTATATRTPVTPTNTPVSPSPSPTATPTLALATITGLSLAPGAPTIPAGGAVVPINAIPADALPSADPLASVPLSSIAARGAPLSSIPLSSIPLSSIPLSSIPLSSIPLSSIGISTAGGWDAVIAGTDLQGAPLQTVSLDDVLRLADGDPAVRSRLPTLGEMDLSSTALRSLSVSGLLLGALPLSSIPLPAAPGQSQLDALCAAVGAAGITCASVGITSEADLAGNSLLGLNLRGVPLSSIPLSSIPLSSIPLSSIPLSSIPLSSIPLSSIPLSSIPLSSIPLSSIAVGSTPLSSIPLSSIALPDGGGSFCVYWSDANFPCPGGVSDASTLGQLITALGSTDPASTPLSSIPLSSIPLSSISVGSTPLSSIPLSSIPLSSIGISGIPLSSIPLSSIPLSSIAVDASPLSSIPLSSIPLSSIGDVVTCTVGGAGCNTLGEAATNGYLVAGADLGDLGYYGSFSIGDLRVPGTFSYFLSFFYGDATLAQTYAANNDLGNLTFGQMVAALLARPDYPWEDLPLDQIDLAGISDSAPVRYTASFGVSGNDITSTSVTVRMPEGFRYKSGTSSLTVDGEVSAGGVEPQVVGSQLTWTFPGGFRAGASVVLAFEARPGLVLGSFAADISVTAPQGSASSNGVGGVLVTENFEPANDSTATAPLIAPDNLYITHISSATDRDFFKVAAPLAGSRISVQLSQQTGDGDLVLYQPVASEARPSAGVPLNGQPLDDAPPDVLAAATPPPETLQDIPIEPLPLSGVSASRGASDESVASTSLDAGSTYTIQVSGYNGQFGPRPYVLRVKVTPPTVAPPCPPRLPSASAAGAVPPVPASTNTLFLVNEQRLTDLYGAVRTAAVMSALDSLVSNGAPLGVGGAVIPVDGDAGVRAAYGAWDADPCSPDAANGIVAAINALVDSIRTTSGAQIRNIVIVGSDDVIPMGRVPDLTRVSNESDYAGDLLQLGANNAEVASFITSNVLSDDPYASLKPVAYLNRQLFPPDLAIGRLIETPEQIAAQLQQFVASGGVLDPQTALITGYDFLSDGAARVADNLDAAIAPNQTERALISETWNRSLLIAYYNGLAVPPDIGSINAHYNHSRLLPALQNSQKVQDDLFTTADLAATPGVLSKRVIFSMGCHAGYNLPDTLYPALPSALQPLLLDWAQAYAGQNAAVFVANTGFGYGDTTLVAYSEELMALFAGNFGGSLSIGDALRFAKQEYRGLDRVQFETYDEKVLVETVMYGLPMYRIGTPPVPLASAAPAGTPVAAVDLSSPSPAAAATPSGAPATPTPQPPAAVAAAVTPSATPAIPIVVDSKTGLNAAQVSQSNTFTLVGPGPLGSYYTIDGQSEATSGRPIQPVRGIDLPRITGRVAHGALLTDLTSVDEQNFDAVFSQPVIDLSTPERPVDAVFPTSISSVTTWDEPDGQRQRLMLMPAQYIPDGVEPAGVGVERRYTQVDALVMYSDGGFVPPFLRRMQATRSGSTVNFLVNATDENSASRVKRVLVLYHEKTSADWQSLDLARGSGDTWTGQGAANADIEYVAFAVDGDGNVASSWNKGDLHQSTVGALACAGDADCDTVPDTADNCVSVFNPDQKNVNGETLLLPKPFPSFNDATNPAGDGEGDACDPDIDGDGIANATESALGTSPFVYDTDGDRTADGVEVRCGSDPLSSVSNLSGTDTDSDGLPDACEAVFGTDPAVRDTDGDGVNDSVEVRYWLTDPLVPNTDGDECPDGKEIATVNGDRVVNAADLGIISKSFGVLAPPFRPYDQNGDGQISAADLGLAASKFGSCAQG